MAWEWQVWRCFDEIRETFASKGWEPGFPERADNEVVPLAAASEDSFVALLRMDFRTGECWFELRDKLRPLAVILRGTQNVPTPQGAARLLAERAAALKEASSPHDRPLYEPVAAEAD